MEKWEKNKGKVGKNGEGGKEASVNACASGDFRAPLNIRIMNRKSLST